MTRHGRRLLVPGLVAFSLVLAGCPEDGDDGAQGPPGPTVINASTVSDSFLAGLDVVSTITDVQISSPPKVTFTLATTEDVPIIGIVPFWEASNNYVRFTMTKLVPGTPDSWVSYTRDAVSNDPDYDTGTELVDHLDGSYTFTFATDVTAVPGIPYEPMLTHRLAGQLGSGSISLEAQNFVYDFVPAGGPVTHERNIAVMESCNECHDDLVFHGRRFLAEYCVTCHNPDLASGEGDMAFMIHKIHNSGTFSVLDGGVSYAEVTYPQDLANCRKCHDAMDPETPQGDHWKMVPSVEACFGCHVEANHPGGAPPPDNSICNVCHGPGMVSDIEVVHTTPNATPNNPFLLAGQVEIAYELMDASVDMMTGDVTINCRILSDGTPLDVANLPADLAGPGRYPAFLLAWALPQDGIATPQDYNNLGQRAAQPLSLDLDGFLGGPGPLGTHAYDGLTGVNTFVVTDPASQYPMGATLRAVGLQGYFEQDILGEIVSLHTPSVTVGVTGDVERRTVVDSMKCGNCHEWFEGHGGNRTFNMQICTMCHVPNLSSTGRTVVDPTLRSLDIDIAAAVMDGSLDPSVDPNDPLTYPEDAQSFKDLVHSIHAAGDRTRPYQHVRGPSRQAYYDWSEITFPRGASTSNCNLCHEDGTYELPLPDDVLATTVRTSGVADGLDPSVMAAETAFTMVPNATDWVNSPTASACLGCHTSQAAMAHMELNGAQVSLPNSTSWWTNRSMLPMLSLESCSVCHGPGKISDIDVVHNR